MIGKCPACKKILIKDILKYVSNYPNEVTMCCCYCGATFDIDSVEREVLE